MKMFFKSRKRLKLFFFLFLIGLLIVTIIIFQNNNPTTTERLIDERFLAKAYINAKLEQPPLLLKAPLENGKIVLEKYDENRLKQRIIQDKIFNLKKQLQEEQQQQNAISEEEHTTLESLTSAIHIFYVAPVPWYKTKKPSVSSNPNSAKVTSTPNEQHQEEVPAANAVAMPATTVKPIKILNTAFYPSLGLYKPTLGLLRKHFENIRNCGIGVLILSISSKTSDIELQNQILNIAPSYNLSVTFELNVASNQSVEFFKHQLESLKQFSNQIGFYKVFSQSRQRKMPVIYVSNAYKLSDTIGRLLCQGHPDSLRRVFNAFFIGHIRLKNHAEVMKRLCFDGFYNKLPSNGATFASSWKNWSYLKTFALTYKMLFIPTVGPGFAERNKFPRHGDIQRHRSNGRYYGVAWRTAILNHVGFVSVASYNNWQDGSQIEEVVSKAGFLDYSPGKKTKYLDLTTHWVGNFMKTRLDSISAGGGNSQLNCYELLNNTIC